VCISHINTLHLVLLLSLIWPASFSTMSATSEALKKQRLLALALAWAWNVVASCIGLNALIKTNQLETYIRKLAPPGVTLKFDINDVYQTGVIVTSICATVAVIISIFFAGTLIRPKRSADSLKIQAWILTFFSTWLLATQIPYTDFTATRYAKITAYLDGVQLPAATTQAALATTGLSNKYSKLHHTVLLAIFPWIALLFNIILVVVLFAASRRRDEPGSTLRSSMVEREKDYDG